jgi:hypothetical protein
MKEILLEKLYYGRFTHRAVIKHYKSTKLKTKTRWDQVHKHDDIVNFAKGALEELRTRESGYWVSHQSSTAVFFNDASFIDALTEKYGDQFESIERPKDAAHVEMLKEKFITRKALFHGQFRYRFKLDDRKVSLSYYNYWTSAKQKDARTQQWDEIEQWIKTQLPDEKNMFKLNGEVYVGTNGYAPTVFFSEYKHATMFKLTWNDVVKDFVRVKLHTEI